MASLVDNKGGALGFLLRNLLGFYRGGEFGGEGEVLGGVIWMRGLGGIDHQDSQLEKHHPA